MLRVQLSVLCLLCTVFSIEYAASAFTCANVRCKHIADCPNPIAANPRIGRCCPICPKIDCRLVFCALATCPNPIPADPKNGKCCPTCPPIPTEPPTLDCRLVRCARPPCPNPLPKAEGECCQRCPDPEPPTLDCSLVSCFVPCKRPLPPPKGECCPICPRNSPP